MKANLNLYPASSSANVSLNRLKEVVNIGNNIGLHLFHGILNSDGDSPPRHIYCYCISFLQMFLHCEDMFDYFSQEDLKDKNEILIHDIIKSMKDKKVKKFIQIYNFIASWKGWNNRRMPRKMKDIRYFVRFFLKSLSQTIQDFFYIDIDSAERTVYGYSFYLQIPSTADTLQKNLDLKLSTCYNIRKLPKYLLLYMDREENGGGFKTNYVAVNTYITIANHNYRFLSSVLYTGTYKSGHYSTLIKLANKHFYFNDNDVYPVFFTKNSTSKTPNLVYDTNNGLNRNSVLFLYEDFNDQFDPGAFEIIDNRVYKNKEIVSNLSRFFKDISNDPNIQMSNSNDNSQNNSQDNSGFNSQDNSQYNSGFNSQNSSQNNSDDDSNSFFLFSTVSSNISSYSTESSSDIDDNINTNDDNTNDDNTNTNKNNSKNQSNSFPRPFIEANPSDNDVLQLNQVESTPVSPRYISLVRYASQKFNLSESLIDEILGKNLNVSNHSGLQKEKVIVENLNATNLNGVLFIHNNGIPSCSKTNDEKGKFMIYRKLFLYAGSVLKNLEFNDLGKTNSETYKIKLNIPQILAEEIKEKGKLVYKILRKIIDEGDFSYQKVKERLMPILNWYRNKFSNIMTRDVLSNKAIDDNLGKVLKENIFSRSGDDFFSLSTEDLLNTEEEEDQINIEDDIEKELNTRQYNEEEEEEEEEQEEEEENVEYKKNLRSGNDYRLGYHDYLPSDDQSDLNQINLFDDEPDLTGDDNEFVLGEYDWKNRAKFTDAKDIREKLVDLFSNHPDQIPRGKIELRSLIISEFLNEYTQMGYLFPSRSKFIDDYISRNSDPLTKSKIVKEYEDIIERENQRIKKERHKRKTKEEKKIHEKRQKKKQRLFMENLL